MGKKAKKSRLGQRKAAPPLHPAKPDGPLVQPPPPSPYYRAISVLPNYVAEAAGRLKQGTLSGQIIERQYLADEKPVLRFLETLNESGEPAALTKLAGLLRGYPMLLQHPYVWGIFQNLYRLASLLEELKKYKDDLLTELIKAWAEGMTLGLKVAIEKPGRGHGGQVPELFPHLEDREGWLYTEEAEKERLDARELRQVYDDLMDRLKGCVDWKAVRRRYGPGRPAAIYELADKIGLVFEQFKQERRISTAPLSREALVEIARKGLEERRGGNPRHKVACALLAALPWYNIRGHPMTLRPTTVESTLKTLRKHAIGPEKPGSNTSA